MNRKRTNLNVMGVYAITNLTDGKVYIGKARNIRVRWNAHKRELKNGIHINKHLQSAWNKYGENSFKFEIIYYPTDDADMLKIEEMYIEQYNAMDRNFGYNLTSGGESGVLSEESIAKVSNSRIGKYNELNENDIKHIKMLAYCFIDKREIASIYNVPLSTIGNIITGETYKHILSGINEFINNIKQQIIDARNLEILRLYDDGYKICQIRDLLKLTNSVVEKCVYKYRGTENFKSITSNEEIQKIIDLYFNKGLSTIKISETTKISKPRILKIIDDYRRNILGTLSDDCLSDISSFYM